VSDGFSLDWLRLREPHDLRARSRALARQFGAAVRARAGREIASVIDLGAGSGANFRVLAPLIPGDQDWRLVDHDRAVLAHQAAEIAQWARGQGWRVTHGSGVVTVATGTAHWRAHGVALDLAHGLAEMPLAVHGATCAALLDLVSAPWLEALCDRVAAARIPFLAALTIDGRRDWSPAHPDDAEIARAFVQHQRRDKGFGPALGPDAPAAAERLFSSRGYRVATAGGAWRLTPSDDAVLTALIDETVAACGEVDPPLAIDQWWSHRFAELMSAELCLCIGHVDILAEPDKSPAAQT
jgi:hypothetical protein